MHYLFLLSLLLLHQLAFPQPIERLDGSTISSHQLSTEIERLMYAADVHGLGVSIFNQQQLVFEQSFGFKNYEQDLPLRVNTHMYGASLSKAVFAVLVLKLVENGLISLDEPLQNYLPQPIYTYQPQARWHDDFSDLRKDSLYHKITARMCLNHTSGFPNWRWFMPDKQLKVVFEPGSRYSYSGEGLTYLQVILEKLSGRSLESMAQEYIFAPLQMNSSSFTWQPQFKADFAYGHARTGAHFAKDIDNEARAASTLETTIADYSLFLQAVLQKKLLKQENWKQLFTPGIRIRSVRQFGPLAHKDSSLNEPIQLAYGLGWGLIETPYGRGIFKEGHGEGFQHYSILFPEAGKGILLMSNSDNAESIFQELLQFAIADCWSPTEWNNYIPYQQRGDLPKDSYGYGCPACNQACDTPTFNKAGNCPNCHRMLKPKIAFMDNKE